MQLFRTIGEYAMWSIEDLARADLRQHLKRNVLYKPKKVQGDLERDLKPGWMNDNLVRLESLIWGRWSFWTEAWALMRPPARPIPQIEFHDMAEKTTLGMLERCLDQLQSRGMSYWGAIEFLLDWILFSLGEGEKPTNHRASMDLYQCFCLDLMLLYPFDYWGRLLSEVGHGKRTGFYPTPMTVTKMMAQMQMADIGYMPQATVCDPCAGTGRMLLVASNASLRLYGQDIDYLVLKACKVNMWLYAPWGVHPLPDSAWERFGETPEVETTSEPPEDQQPYGILEMFGE